MSFITDVLITTAAGESPAVAFVNEWLAGLPSHCVQQLAEISTDGAGGCKVSSLHVYAAAFDYLPVAEFTGAIRRAPWRFPLSVVAYIDNEADDTYVMSPARPGRWTLALGEQP